MPQNLRSSKMESVGNQAPLVAPVALAGAAQPRTFEACEQSSLDTGNIITVW